MKILYFNYLYDTTESSVGAAVHVQEFVRAARSCGVDIRSFDLNKFSGTEGKAPSRGRNLLKKKLSRYLNQVNALISNISYARKEWRIIKREKPDAILVRYNLLNFSAALIAKIKKIPLVLEVNAPMALENREFNNQVKSLPWVPEWSERLNLKLADRVITVSQTLRNYFVESGIPAHKIHVVPNAVDVDHIHPELDGKQVREALAFQDSLVIGFVGSFHFWHGVEFLESYVKKLVKSYEKLHFLFVGNGPLKDQLETSFAKNGLSRRVVFTGYVPNEKVPQYLAAMDIALAPYPKMEFFYFSPLKLFEYMAAAKPVVASKIGQISELVQHGENGLLYEAGNVSQLISRSRELIDDPSLRKRLGLNARQTILTGYSWKENAQKILDIVDEIVEAQSNEGK